MCSRSRLSPFSIRILRPTASRIRSRGMTTPCAPFISIVTSFPAPCSMACRRSYPAPESTRAPRRALESGFPEVEIMAEITASLVKELREKTGAGMMDCKRALGETSGDIEGAVDWLRKKGLAAAAKKAGRVAAEGLVGFATPGGYAGAVIEVNSETDFVARNEAFQNFVRQ